MIPITHKIEETNTELCIVGLPDNTKAWKNYTYHVNTLWYKSEGMRNPKCIDLPKGEEWQWLSLYSELTEERLEGIMPSELSVLETEVYRNYKEDTYRKYYSLSSALESFNSLMTKLECYTVNPYGGKPNERDMLDFELVSCFEEAIYLWTEAQQRTHSDYAILIRTVTDNSKT